MNTHNLGSHAFTHRPIAFGRSLLLLTCLISNATATDKIAWYGQLADGLAESKRSGRPILLVSAAPHCSGVPGIW